ncbi:uncharacterized protein LOC109599939 [Aethina tumida]|uniref:uncharacterized protein LOC109599939 n=1 Tax=Aethina tumida TaxID=116153 RepID=UPI0021478DE8|nr:uncharacterized protein LOC109599939 [Aethina tumida]
MYVLVASLLLLACTQAVEIQIGNDDGGDIWVGIQGDPNNAHLNYGGVVIGSKQTVTLYAPPNWHGRIWARTWCSGLNNHCLTGDCGSKLYCASAGPESPVTLVEFQMQPSGDHRYAISTKRGFNILAKVESLSGNCDSTSCQTRINNDCPDELKYDTSQGVLGCKSACVAFNNDEYCCTGDNSGDNCNSNKYTDWFSNECPDTITMPNADLNRQCNTDGFKITFGG